MNKYVYAACAASFLVVSANLFAQSSGHDEHQQDRHSFLQFSHVIEKEAAENLTLTGAALLGRYDLTDPVFLRGEIERVSDTGVEESAGELAVAYVLNPHAAVEYHVAGLYGYAEVEEGGSSESTDAYGAELGFHASLNDHLMLHGELAWLTESSDSVVGAELGLFYRMSEHLGLNAEYGRDEDRNEALELGVRFSF